MKTPLELMIEELSSVLGEQEAAVKARVDRAMPAYKGAMEALAAGTATPDQQRRTGGYVAKLEGIVRKLPPELLLLLMDNGAELEMKAFRVGELPKGLSIDDAIEVDLAAMKEPEGHA